MVTVNTNTWWIDSGSTIHISNSLQGMQNLRKPVKNEQFILSGNKIGSHVEAIGTCYLNLDGGFVLELQRTFYVPSFSRNLILVSKLVPFGYSFHFLETPFNLIVLGMVFCLMVFIAYSYKMIPLIIHYMSKLALRDVL